MIGKLYDVFITINGIRIPVHICFVDGGKAIPILCIPEQYRNNWSRLPDHEED